ncbi:MAG: hypothetical protein PF961_04680 [Planctomycetota bacterium]|jgi:hypothetical protein|nr:hypothetical protein [Planctomycetota bacterium]
MLHGTCVTADGAWRPNRAMWQQIATEFAQVGPWLQQHPPAQAELAVALSPPAAWALSIDPTDDNMQYETLFRDRIHAPLQARGLWRDVIGKDADLSPTACCACH